MAFGSQYKLLVQLGIDHAKLQKDTNKVSKTFNQLGSNLQMAGIRMSVAFTAPVVLFVRAMVKELGAFEQKMTRSTAIMGELSTAMKANLVETAAEVAAKVPRSAKEAAEGYFFLASAGLSATQAVSALPAVMDFAIAGNFDLARATSLSADAQSALGLKSEDTAENLRNLTRVTDVLVKANTLANATTEQFSRSLTTKAGAAIKIVGKSLEEGTAVLAAFADQGIKAEMAGTALNIVFRDLKTKGLKFKQEWAKLGGVFDKVTGEMRPMADIVEGLEKHIGNLSPELAQTELKLLGFSDKSLVFTQALIGMSDKIREYERSLLGAAGTTKEVAAKQIQNLADQFTMAKQRIEGAVRAIAMELRPILTAIIGVINLVAAAMRGFAEALDSWFAIIPWILTGLAGILAILGPLTLALGMLAFVIAQVAAAQAALAAAGLAYMPVLKGLAIALAVGAAAFTAFAIAGTETVTPMEKVLEVQRNMVKSAKQAQTDLKDLIEAKQIKPGLRRQLDRINAELKPLEAVSKSSWWEDFLAGFATPPGGSDISGVIADARNEARQAYAEAQAAIGPLKDRQKELQEQLAATAEHTEDAALKSKRLAVEQQVLAAATHIVSLATNMSKAAYVEAGRGAQTFAFAIDDNNRKLVEWRKALALLRGSFKETHPKVIEAREKVKSLTTQIKALGGEVVQTTVVLGRFAETALGKAQDKMGEFVATAVKLNEALAPGQFDQIITEWDFMVQKVQEYEGALQKIIEEGMKEGLSPQEIFDSEEFGPEIQFIIDRITELNAKISDGEPYQKAQEHIDQWVKKGQEGALKWAQGWTSALDTFRSGTADAFASSLIDGEDFGDAMKEVFKNVLKTIISTLAEMVIQWALSSLLMSQVTNMSHAAKIAAYTSEAAALAAASAAWAGPGAMAAAAEAAIGTTIAQASLGYTLGSAAGHAHGALQAVPAAKGGIFTNPTLALIGEAGAEAVIPLTGPNSFGGSQHINLYMDGQLITETVLNNMPNEVRLNIGAAI